MIALNLWKGCLLWFIFLVIITIINILQIIVIIILFFLSLIILAVLLGDLDTINCVVQYYSPSISTIETTYSSYDSRRFTDISSDFTDSIFARGDFPIIFICNFIIVLVVLFVINNLSKLFYKGGVFGPH